ncbi:MAG: hypothetical protein QCI82_10010 [Candidatus Thermoplasmatota archaeon]|nr:hypothetical protein [Candidatus Thermoplasmatota archaeon]
MPRSKDGYKIYKAGDPIHIVVTQEFAESANEFFSYCKEKGYNPSEIIRQAMVEWYRREKENDRKVGSLPPELSLDDKLMRLASQRTERKPTVRPLSARQILEE